MKDILSAIKARGAKELEHRSSVNNILRISIVLIGVLICGITVLNFITAPEIQSNTKSMTFVYEVQDDGSLKLIEEQQHIPMTITNGLLLNVCAGMIMILWTVYLYPKKKCETMDVPT